LQYCVINAQTHHIKARWHPQPHVLEALPRIAEVESEHPAAHVCILLQGERRQASCKPEPYSLGCRVLAGARIPQLLLLLLHPREEASVYHKDLPQWAFIYLQGEVLHPA
jgi:hypothetical protein